MRSTILLIVSALLLITPQQNRRHRVEHLEVDGVPIVRSSRAPKYRGSIFERTTDLIIGIEEGEPEWQMFRLVGPVLALPDGRIYLAGGATRYRVDIFIIDKEGQLIRRIGGRGSGPGEFQQIDDMEWSPVGNELWVRDRVLHRVSRFSLEGEYLGSIDYADQTQYWSSFECIDENYVLGRKAIYGEQKGFLLDVSRQYSLLDSELNWIKDFLRLQFADRMVLSGGGQIGLPIVTSDSIIPFTDGKLLHAKPNEGRLTVLSIAGDPELHIERDWEFTRIRVSRIRSYWIENTRNPEQQALFRKMPIPDREPAFDDLLVDNRNRIWIKRYWLSAAGFEKIPPQTYDIFGPDGVWIGTEVFEHFIRYISEDYVYLITKTDEGAPCLKRIRIEPLIPEVAGKKLY